MFFVRLRKCWGNFFSVNINFFSAIRINNDIILNIELIMNINNINFYSLFTNRFRNMTLLNILLLIVFILTKTLNLYKWFLLRRLWRLVSVYSFFLPMALRTLFLTLSCLDAVNSKLIWATLIEWFTHLIIRLLSFPWWFKHFLYSLSMNQLFILYRSLICFFLILIICAMNCWILYCYILKETSLFL